MEACGSKPPELLSLIPVTALTIAVGWKLLKYHVDGSVVARRMSELADLGTGTLILSFCVDRDDRRSDEPSLSIGLRGPRILGIVFSAQIGMGFGTWSRGTRSHDRSNATSSKRMVFGCLPPQLSCALCATLRPLHARACCETEHAISR